MECQNRILNMREMWISIFDHHSTKLSITEKPNPLEILIEILYLQFQRNKYSFHQCNCNVNDSSTQVKSNNNAINNSPIYDITPKKCDKSLNISLTDNNLISKKMNLTSNKSPVFVSKLHKTSAKKQRKSSKKLFSLKDNTCSKNQDLNMINDQKEDISIVFKNKNEFTNHTEILDNKDEFEVLVESDNEFDTAIIGINNEISLSDQRCNSSKKDESDELVNVESVLEYLKNNDENNQEPELNEFKRHSQKEYAYKRDACRKKSERMKLQGWECHMCKKYYECLGITDKRSLKERMNKCSRHRSKYQEIYNTPKGFWNPEFSPD